MSGDPGSQLPDPRPADYSIPRVLDIKISATKAAAPEMRNFISTLTGSDDAVEFLVKTERPIPIRALGPALYVGEAVVTEVAEIGPNTYRFVARDRTSLEHDAPIALSWTGQRPTDVEGTTFRYRLPLGR